MRSRLAGLALVVGLTAGCFTYVPGGPGTVSPGDDVRITVDDARTDRFGELFGESFTGVRQQRLDGTVVSIDDDRLLVTVPVTVRRRGVQNDVLHQQVDIREDEIARLDVREVDWMRTGPALAVGAAAVGIVILRTFSNLIGGSDGVEIPPQRPQLRPARP